MNRVPTALTALVCLLVLACQEPKQPPVARANILPDSATQLIFGARLKLTEGGVSRGDVHADTAYMYDENTRVEMRRLSSVFYTTTGEKNATLTARAGTYHVRVGTMEARGDVVVVSADGRKLETQQLRYDPQRAEISSDSAFTYTTQESVVQGIGFIADPQMRNVKVLRALKTSGHAVKIPKR